MTLLRSPVIRRAAALVLLPCYLAACTRWVTPDQPLATIAAEGPRTLRVALSDESRVVLHKAYLANDSLIGVRLVAAGGPASSARAEVRTAVPLTDVVSFEVADSISRVSVVGAVGALVMLGGFAAIIALATTNWDGIPSCPLVYGWDGTGWTLESATFASSLTPNNGQTSTDVLARTASDRGEVRLRLANEHDEIDHIDRISVSAVDHAPRLAVVPDPNGLLHTIRDLTAPLTAHDTRGHDALARVSREDDWRWESSPTGRDSSRLADLQDTLHLTFVRPPGATSAKLVVSGSETTWAAALLWEYVSLHGSGTQTWYHALDTDPGTRAQVGAMLTWLAAMQVAVRERDGWRVQGQLAETGPEIDRRQVVPLDLRAVEGDTIRVALRSTPSMWVVDQVGIDYSPDEPVVEMTLPLVSAVTDAGVDVTFELRASDQRFLRQVKGEGATLTFADRPVDSRSARSYVLRARGWFRLTTPDTAPPRTALLNRLLEDSTAVTRWAVGALAATLARLERQALLSDETRPQR